MAVPIEFAGLGETFAQQLFVVNIILVLFVECHNMRGNSLVRVSDVAWRVFKLTELLCELRQLPHGHYGEGFSQCKDVFELVGQFFQFGHHSFIPFFSNRSSNID